MPSEGADTFDFEVMKGRVEMGLSERHDKGWLLQHNIMRGRSPRHTAFHSLPAPRSVG
jgi:hypothetical protein